jgi:hypothetical protein
VETIGKISAAVLAIIVVAGLAVGIWKLGWFVNEKNVQENSRIFRTSFANQERLREDLSEKVSEVRSIEVTIGELSGKDPEQEEQLAAQAAAITEIACHDSEQISEGLSPEQESFIASRC